jgi:hypothetical protein
MNNTAVPSLWNLPANPVFQRYAASRLRPVRLTIYMVTCQLLTGFIWAVAVLIYLHSQNASGVRFDFGTPEFKALLYSNRELAFLNGWFAVLFVQGLLVILKGTFSVATGVAREANEGMMEGMDLTPMSPSRKVMGQLLGLPLLENLLAVSLIPWAILSAVFGGLSLVMVGKVYLVFATSALFHHSIGLVAGTIIRQKILAGTLSQISVLMLHLVLPLCGGMGIGIISHLGMKSAILAIIAQETPSFDSPFKKLGSSMTSSSVEFFGWEFGVAGYHWLITASSLAFLLWILLRRWHDRESLLLGKIGTTLAAAWILIFTCGELIPRLTHPVNPHHTSELDGMKLTMNFLDSGDSSNASAMPLVFGMVIGLLNLMFISLLIPSLPRRLTARNEPWWGDGREALPWVFGISLMSISAWLLVIYSAREFDASSLPPLDATTYLYLACSIIIPSFTWYSLVLWQGWKKAVGIGFTFGLLPLMVAIIGLLVSASPGGWPKWLLAMSGLVMPGFAFIDRVASKFSGHLNVSSALVLSASLHTVAAIYMFYSARRMLRSR